MSEIKRSAGTAYIDLALARIDQVIAQAREVGKAVDEAVNTQVEQSGEQAGEKFTRGFRRTSEGFPKPIQDELDKVKEKSKKSGDEAGDNFAKGFLAKVGPPVDRAFTNIFADLEGKSNDSGTSSGNKWSTSFLKYVTGSLGRLRDDFRRTEKEIGGSGSGSGDNWGKNFFNSASGWFDKLQKKQKESGLGLSAAALAPLGIAGGSGLLGGVLAAGSSLVAPGIGVGAFGALLKSDLTGANTALQGISQAGGNQGQISADIKAQQAVLTTKAYQAQEAALKRLNPAQLQLIKALGDANTSYTTLSPAQQKNLATISSGTAAYSALLPAQKQAVASLLAQQKAYDAVTPAQQGFVTGLQNLKKSATELQSNTAPLVSGAFTAWIPLAQRLLAAVQPVVGAAANAFTRLGNEASKAAQNPAFDAFFNKIVKQINGGAIDKLVHGIGQLGSGLATLWVKFGGSGKFLTDFDAMSSRFAKWTQDQGADGSFSKFLDYMKSNGQTVIQAIGNLGTTLSHVAGASAGLGHMDLSILSNFLGLLAHLPASVSAPLVAVGTQLALFSKLGGFAALSGVSGFIKDLGNSESGIRKFAGAMISATTSTWEFVTSLSAEKIAQMASAAVDGIATAAQWLWNAAMDAFPLIAITAAIIALVVVIVKYHHQIWDFVVKIWHDIWAFLKQWWYVLILAVFTGGLGLIVGLVIKYHNDIWNFIVRMWNDVTGFFTRTWDKIWNTVSDRATKIWHSVTSIFGNMKNDVYSIFKSMINDSFVIPINFAIDHVLNGGIIRGVNDITGLLGIPKIPNIPDIPKFAFGGLVPGRGTGDTVPAMLMPEEGVLSVPEIRALGGAAGFARLRQFLGGGQNSSEPDRNGVVHAKFGWNPISDARQVIGDVKNAALSGWDALKNVALGGARSAFKAVADPVVNSIHPPPSFNTQIHSVASYIENKILGYLGAKDKTASTLGGIIASGAHKILIDQALSAVGLPNAVWGKWETGLNTLIGRESGWSSTAQNNVDINAKNGDPSRGLMQTIMSTFQSFRLPSLPDDIFNPLSNIVAGIRYILSRYGDITNVQQANAGLPPKGYDNGGYLTPGMNLVYNGLGRPEPVLTPEQFKAMANGGNGQTVVSIRLELDGKELDYRADTRIEKFLTSLDNALSGGRIVSATA